MQSTKSPVSNGIASPVKAKAQEASENPTWRAAKYYMFEVLNALIYTTVAAVLQFTPRSINDFLQFTTQASRFAVRWVWDVLCFTAWRVMASQKEQGMDQPNHPYKPAGASDSRGPCPFLNSLANHDYFPHSGKEITLYRALKAVHQVGKLGYLQTIFLVSIAFVFNGREGKNGRRMLSLHNLANIHSHNMVIEHDVSLLRQDVSIGDSQKQDPELLKQLLSHSSDGHWVTASDLVAARAQRYQQSKTQNPRHVFGHMHRFLASVEDASMMSFVSEPLDGDAKRPTRIALSKCRDFLEKETFTDTFYKRGENTNEGVETIRMKLLLESGSGIAPPFKDWPKEIMSDVNNLIKWYSHYRSEQRKNNDKKAN